MRAVIHGETTADELDSSLQRLSEAMRAYSPSECEGDGATAGMEEETFAGSQAAAAGKVTCPACTAEPSSAEGIGRGVRSHDAVGIFSTGARGEEVCREKLAHRPMCTHADDAACGWRTAASESEAMA